MDCAGKFHRVRVVADFTDAVNALTHTPPHHADEAFATAMLSFLQPMTIYCTRDPQILQDFNGFIYDVGGEYDHAHRHYDHHQRDFDEQHPNSCKMAAAGLIWRHYGEQIIATFDCPSALTIPVFQLVDRELISGLDANDNGQLENGPVITLPAAFGLFAVGWDEDIDSNATFIDMIQFAQKILQRAIITAISYVKGQSFVDAAIAKASDQYFIMYKTINNWSQMVTESQLPQAQKLLYGITKDAVTNTWRIRALPPDRDHQMAQRKKFPSAWRGRSGSELAQITGVETAQFCHATGFLAIAGTKSDAIKLAELAIATPEGT